MNPQEPMRFNAAWSLLGAAPILGARLWCHGCGEETEVMVLSHGKYNFEGSLASLKSSENNFFA